MKLFGRILLFSFLLQNMSSYGKPTRYEVKDAAFRNLISWISDATLEKTLASSHFISGWFELDPQNLKAGIKGEMEVDVRSFELGPDSRQAKIRDSVLLAQENPGALYKIDKLHDLSHNELVAGKAVTAKVSGMLFARGVLRRQDMQIKAVYHPESERTKRRMTGNLIKVSSYFDLALSDYKCPIPEGMEGLFAPVLRVSADVVGTDQLPTTAP
jgi:hypothetical protein